MKTSPRMEPAPRLGTSGAIVWMLLGVLALAVVALAAIVLLPRLRAPQPESSQATWPPAGWSTGTPEEHGLDSAKLADGLLKLYQDKTHVHSITFVHNGSVILDANFYPYDGKSVHDLASVTKSIMTTLIGIAADQGKLSLDAPMVSFFPERTIANLDALKEKVTVRHLAGMASGLSCTRAGGEMTLREMRASPDWVQFVLDRKVTVEPGTVFNYCSPGMYLLSAILTKATGMSALDFARQNLFGPLGITDAVWPAGAQGYNHGWGDLDLHPHDLAKIGYLWLNKGEWQGKQIVSRQWVEASVQPLLRADQDDWYGYGWWVGSAKGPWEYSAEGNGGQTIMVYPELNFVVVTTGGTFSYDQVGELISSATVDPSQVGKPLPANPEGVAKLNEALKTIAQCPDQPMPVPSMPAIAAAVSGKTYAFDPESTELRAVRLTFNPSAALRAGSTPAEAYFELAVSDEQPLRGGPVGLDGVYRISPSPSPGGALEAFRGRWSDDQTFLIDYDRIGNREGWVLWLRFEGTSGDVVSFEGRDREGRTIKARAEVQAPSQ